MQGGLDIAKFLTSADGSSVWSVVAALAVASGLVLGLTTTALGLFVGPIQQAYHASAGEAARVVTAYLLFMTFGAPLGGWLIDRFGSAPVATVGAAAVALGCLLGSQGESLPLLAASMSLAGLGAGASTYVPCALVVRNRAGAHAALALGAYLAAVSLICSVTPIVLSRLLAVLGWNSTLRWVAVVIAVVTVPLTWRMARTTSLAPEAMMGRADRLSTHRGVAAGFGSRGFWLIALVQVFTGLGFQQVYNHVVPYLTSCGYAPERSAMIFGATNATSAAGFFLFGLLADRIGPRRALIAGVIVCALSTPALLGAAEAGIVRTVLVAVFVLFWGATCSLSTQFVPVLLGGIVGERHFAALLGSSYVIYGVAGAAGPSITGHLVDRTHGYGAAFLLAAALMLASVVPVLALKGVKNA